jgi:O-methyltransferase domain
MDSTEVDKPLHANHHAGPAEPPRRAAPPATGPAGSATARAGADPKDVVVTEDPRAAIWGLIRGQWRFSALYAFVDLGLADRMAAGPVAVGELAEQCGLDALALARLLRTNAALGVVRTLEGAPGERRYELTEAGHTLREDDERSMRSVVIPQGSPEFLTAMGSLADAVRTGRAPFADLHGSFYGYLESNAEARAHFDAHMATRSRTIAEAVAECYDFTGVSTLADIGGGLGTILAVLLRANPGLRGLLFELAPVVRRASGFLDAQGVSERCELVEGDFFATVPQADAYLLSNIVHNWADEAAVRILRGVRSAMPVDGRVLLLDMLLADDDRPHLGKELDMRLLALHQGGRERTETEYLGLLGEAGLVPKRVVELPYALSLIEAFPG